MLIPKKHLASLLISGGRWALVRFLKNFSSPQKREISISASEDCMLVPKRKKKCFLMLEQCWCFPGQGFVWKINTAEQSFPALARALLFLCPVCAACIPHLSSHYRALPAEGGCGHACTLFFLFPLLGNSDSFANSSHWNWAFYVVYHERGKLGTVAVTLQRDCSSHFAVLNLLWCL